jgi:murein DD-endopeptidase MepM/ murein hydrolase activator NlpD
MAGAPQKKYQEDIEPDIRPNLSSIQGGGESTPGRANLKAVSNSEANPDKPTSGGAPVGEQEAHPSGASNVIRGPWANNTTAQTISAKLPGKFKRGKKIATIGGVGIGILAIPILLLFLFFPLKLEMFIKNITGIASSVPEYAVGQRMEYLVTRALAVRLLASANNMQEADAKLVFCNNGAIACSLFATYSTDYFERKLGITLEADVNGRIRLGGKASSWDISLGKENGLDIQGPMKRIQSNSEMKALIRKEVYEKGKSYSVLTRYITRKLLMKKFGVVFWRGPPKLEQTANRLADARANIKSNIVKGTIGKISPRLAIYLTCLQDSATCSKLRSQLSSALKVPEEPDPDSPNYEEEKAQYARDVEKYETSKSILEGTKVSESDAKGPLKGLISKKVLSVVGGGAAAIGAIDLVLSAVDSINNGALEKIWYDMSTQAYVGFSTEMQVINDKLKLGELDTDTVAAAFELFEGAESAPLNQVESGLKMDTSQGITTNCKGPAGDEVPTKLEPGQVVCSDQRVVRDYTSGLVANPGWAALATVAAGWEASVGKAYTLIGEGIGNILQIIPGFTQLMDLAGGAIQPIIDWFIGLIFEPPGAGPDETGATNYTALSAGIRVENNATFEEGVDEDGTAMGGGGNLLTDEEVAVINRSQQQSELEDFNSQSAIARIFDTSSRFSFINQLALRFPSSLSGLAQLPLSSFGTIFSGASVSAASAEAVNPFNMPLYGYAKDDPALSADPGIYTESYCEGTAAARAETFRSQTPGSIETYAVSDPCALEKMVVGTALNAEGIYDDPYSLKYPKSGGEAVSSEVVLPVDKGYASPLPSDADFGPRQCEGCSTWHRGVDFQIGMGSPVYAVGAGVVTESGIGGPGSADVPGSCPTKQDTGGNNTVKIKLDSGEIAEYMHMGGQDITVSVGDRVTPGQQIGRINICGESWGPHLHFVIDPGESTNPDVLALTKGPPESPRVVDPVLWFKIFGINV